MKKIINSKKVSLKKLMMMASLALAAFSASSKANTITALATNGIDIPTDGEPWEPKNEFEEVEHKKKLETPPSPILDSSDNSDPYKEVLFDDTESYDVEPIDDNDVLGNEVTTSEEETVTSVANDGASTGVSIDEYPPLPPITSDYTDLDKFIPKEDFYLEPDPDMDLDKETVKTVHEESKPKSSSEDNSSDFGMFSWYLYLLGIIGLKKLNEMEKRESEEDEEEIEETVETTEKVQDTVNDNVDLDNEENEYESSYQTEEEQKHRFSFFR